MTAIYQPMFTRLAAQCRSKQTLICITVFLNREGAHEGPAAFQALILSLRLIQANPLCRDYHSPPAGYTILVSRLWQIANVEWKHPVSARRRRIGLPPARGDFGFRLLCSSSRMARGRGRVASRDSLIPSRAKGMDTLEAKLKEIAQQFEEIEAALSDPANLSNRARMTGLSRKHAELLPLIQDYRKWIRIHREIQEVHSLLASKDSEIAELAQSELDELKEQESAIRARLQEELTPKDPNAHRNTIIEIRAGTGGEEAALFAGDLFRMYSRYAESKQWTVEVLSSNPTGLGGYKEIIFMVSGPNAYSRLKFEGGTHRVQRVPETEASGRVHTSAATVAVLPEAEEVDIQIAPEDLRIDVFRSSGPGGQSVNTTDSAVRITHIPTGLVVTCQDEKSQHKNRARALKVLRSRLLELEQQKQFTEQHLQRRSMVGSGDRSERIRTYNFPQNRLTDHRINLTLHRLDSIMEGELDDIIDALIQEDQLNRLRTNP